MAPIFLFLFFFKLMQQSNAVPGESIIRAFCRGVCLGFNECKFYGRFISGAQHVLLDDSYLAYFQLAHNDEENRKKLFLKIASYTSIYMLQWKMEQNQQSLMAFQLMADGRLSTSFYKYTNDLLKKILYNYIWNFDYERALCFLLEIKQHLFKLLEKKNINFKEFDTKSMKEKCSIKENAIDLIEKSYEEINEWMLSDMLHFFDQRRQIIKYFQAILRTNDPLEIERTSDHFIDLFGVARSALICNEYFLELGKICEFSLPNYLYELAYIEYFVNETVLGRWRIKMVIEFNLYNIWIQKLFDEKFEEIYEKQDAANSVEAEHMGVKLGFLSVLLEFWTKYNKIFWHSEKKMRKRMDKIFNKCKTQNLNIEQMAKIAEADEQNAHGKLSEMLFWENGPEEIALYRALSICIHDAISKFFSKFTHSVNNPAKLIALNERILAQLVLCIGKKMKNTTPRNDEFLSKMHFDNLLQICEENEELNTMIVQNKKHLKDFMGPNWVKKLMQVLNKNDEYFSVPESFTDSDRDNYDEDEIFNDAADNFNENCKKIVENSNKMNTHNSLNDETNNQKFEEQNLFDGNEINEINGKCLFDGLNEILNENIGEINVEKNKNVDEINEELLALNSENEFWIKQSQYKKAKNKAKNETKKKEIKNKSSSALEHQNSKGKNVKNLKSEKNENLNKRNLESASGKLLEKSKSFDNSDDIEIIINQKDFKYCRQIFIEIGFSKLADLLNDSVLKNVFQLILSENLEEKCMECIAHLNNIALFVRAIHAKVNSQNWANKKPWNGIGTQWEQFLFNDNAQLDDGLQFLQDKLYFLFDALDEYDAIDLSTKSFERFIEIIDENKMLKIRGNLANSSNNQTTQFGTYKIDEFSATLSALEVHECSVLISKGVINFEMIEKLKLEKYLNYDQFFNSENNCRKCLCVNVKLEQRYIEKLQNMLQQKKLDSSLHNHLPFDPELSQYNSLRTNMKIRERELHISNEISAFISPKIGLNNKIEIMNLRRNIQANVDSWAAQFTTTKPRLLVSGSLLMNGYIDGSDMDLLCVLPDKIRFDQIYDEQDKSLFNFLKNSLHDVISINWMPGKVKILRIEHKYIEVDLLTVIVPEAYLLQKELRIEDDKLIEQMSDETSIYPLAGYRSGKYQLSLIPNHKEFAGLLKSIKIWAKNRLIYSGIYGYFNGATLSIMAAKICILYPDAPLSYLLYQFFATYSNWNWTDRKPLVLDMPTPIRLNQIVRKWPPLFGISAMTVITPKFPEQNSTFNVNSYTIRTLIEELKIANQILSDDIKKWKTIFEGRNIIENFQYFAVILCSGFIQFDEFMAFCAFQRSKIREDLLDWASRKNVAEQIEQYHVIPQSEQRFICTLQSERAFGRLWLVGLRLKNGYDAKNLNLEPIYQNEFGAQHEMLQSPIQSLFTEAENIETIINNLRHTV